MFTPLPSLQADDRYYWGFDQKKLPLLLSILLHTSEDILKTSLFTATVFVYLHSYTAFQILSNFPPSAREFGILGQLIL